MPFSLAFGAVGVPQRDLPTRPDEVSTLLAGERSWGWA